MLSFKKSKMGQNNLGELDTGVELPSNQLKVTTQFFKDGEQGNLSTVDFMAKIARYRAGHPTVRQLGIKILNQAGTKSHNHLDEALAIGRWVQQNIRYMKDPDGIELLQDPLFMIKQANLGEARGDCDDMSLLIATLLISIGIRPYFKIVRWKKEKGNYNHIYVVVKEINYRQTSPVVETTLDAIVKDREIGTELSAMSSKLIPI